MRVVLFLMMIILPLVSWSQPLETWLKQAEDHNAGLKAAKAEYEASQQRLKAAGSLSDPALSGTYAIPSRRMDMPFVRSSVTLMQMVPWFGVRTTERAMATAGSYADYESYRRLKQETFLNIKEAYYAIVELEGKLTIQRENVALLQQYKAIATAAYSNGKNSLVDVLRIDLMINEGTSEIALLEKKRESLHAAFRRMVSVDESINVTDSFDVGVITARQDSLINNPELRMLDAQLDQTRQQERLVEKQGMPQFTVGLTAQRMVNQEMNMQMNMVMPMVGLTVPVYRKKYAAARAEAKWMKESISEKKLDKEREINTEISSTKYDLFVAQSKIELYKKQVGQVLVMRNVLVSALANGNTTVKDLLDVQGELIKYKSMTLEAQREYVMGIARLAFVRGED